MYTLLLGSILFASYFFYHSSTKVKFKNRPAWLERLAAKPNVLRRAAFAILIVGLVACCLLHGIGAGIFGWIVYMMGTLCLVVLLDPYHFLKGKHIVIVFLISGFLELLYSYVTPV
ncbi:hypothetical protein HP439_04090 [Sphingobacterium shayense]|uniref:hypothetical protein n=1 Tax=Sphingobacterium shayense TaxID=626343 RepID=UPI00155191AC|nr:hypothetical protein [Sphingobacterium shayense]NQD69902.1 hypothetical protein [Sphingobacterium shayense]